MKITVDIKRVEQVYVLDTGTEAHFVVFEVGGVEVRVPTTEYEVQQIIIDAKKRSTKSHLVSVPHSVGWTEPEAPPMSRVGAPLPAEEALLRSLAQQADVDWGVVTTVLEEGSSVGDVVEELERLIQGQSSVGKVHVPPQFEDVLTTSPSVPQDIFSDNTLADDDEIQRFYGEAKGQDGSSDDLDEVEGDDFNTIMKRVEAPTRKPTLTAEQLRKNSIRESRGGVDKPAHTDVLNQLREKGRQRMGKQLAPHQQDEFGAPIAEQIPQKTQPQLPGMAGLEDEGFPQG